MHAGIERSDQRREDFRRDADPPSASMAARATIAARTISVGSGSPTAPLRPANSCRWKAPVSPLDRGAEIGAEAGVQSVDRLARRSGAVEQPRAPGAAAP